MATINIDNIDEQVFTQNERISKYLQGQLTKEEELAFLEDVKKDPDFKARAIAAARLAKGISDVGKEQDKVLPYSKSGGTVSHFYRQTLFQGIQRL